MKSPTSKLLSLPLQLCAGILSATLCAGSALADKDDQNSAAIRLIKTIPIPSSLAALRSFDISWVDPATERYYLADRSNAGIDVIDARTGTFLNVIHGNF